MMERIRRGLVVLSMLLCGITSATAQVSIGIGTPSVSIGINVPVYPELVAVPNHPVYYAPRLGANYFFYDGMYWVYERDNWYASSWYNGPWGVVHRDVVPAYVLRVPVRYYRVPPPYFRGWRADAAPLWGVHWGNTWAVHRAGWDRWDRTVGVARAPLPVYQRAYVGARYPAVAQQTNIHINNYNYHPRETAVRAHYKEQVAKAPPETRKRFEEREAAQAKKEAAAKSAPAKSAQGKREESAKSAAPGQVKREEGAKSAKEYAPGQVKREEGAKSAKEYAPGQRAKEQGQGSKPDNKGQGSSKGDNKGQGGKPDSKGQGSSKPDSKGHGGKGDNKGQDGGKG